VTVRDTRGREIEAACGQLHLEWERSTPASELPPAPTRGAAEVAGGSR
jgi:hypothetical protein